MSAETHIVIAGGRPICCRLMSRNSLISGTLGMTA